MIEVTGDLWTYPADAYVITTNGTLKRNGEGVMGAGVAKQAHNRWPWLARALGNQIEERGNEVGYVTFMQDESNHVLAARRWWIVFFPVKHNWWEKADLSLISKSVEELQELVDMMGWQTVAMVRPGCGNGRCRWTEVKSLLAALDDRYHIIEKE